MKIKQLFGILCLFLVTMDFTSCSEHEYWTPITLEYENSQVLFDNEARSMTLTLSIEESIPLYIRGGDGKYTVTNPNQEIVQVHFDGEKVSFKPLAIGTASIRIEDASNHLYTLGITIQYREDSYEIYARKYIIQGDYMTVEDKAKLETEIEKTDTDQGYVFRYEEAGTGGTLFTLKGDKKVENKFKKEYIHLEAGNEIEIKENYKISEYYRVTTVEEKHVFYITRDFYHLLATKSLPRITYCLIKDVTESYKAKYPTLEHAYLVYEISWKRNE